ncbi:hypothetical protein E2K98_12990 [Bacillus salipaludis]|uniref:Uncharacterized protein n=1 Tax=Bacillus salipaludis TaxID=2547811 RepID=A0A4R5VT65_9BACI|nr:hypothetical protein E2K98_12990 [Bacillus salipaludis]
MDYYGNALKVEGDWLWQSLLAFCVTLMVSVIYFFIFFSVFDGGNPAETAIYTIGTITVILLSFLITLIFYLIELVQRK